MTVFSCPRCGRRVQAAEGASGGAAPCPGCGQSPSGSPGRRLVVFGALAVLLSALGLTALIYALAQRQNAAAGDGPLP